MTTEPTDAETREDVLEACAIAGYEARAKKTGSPKWSYRDADTQRRYREIAVAAVEMYERLTIAPAEVAASDGVTISRRTLQRLRSMLTRVDTYEEPGDYMDLIIELDAALQASAPATTARDEREGDVHPVYAQIAEAMGMSVDELREIVNRAAPYLIVRRDTVRANLIAKLNEDTRNLSSDWHMPALERMYELNEQEADAILTALTGSASRPDAGDRQADLDRAYHLGSVMSRVHHLTLEELADFCRLFPESITARIEREVHGETRIGSATSGRREGSIE